MINYCTRCVQPDTRPGIFLDKHGVCSACVGHEEKIAHIDWEARRAQLESIFERFRGKNGTGYDCIIPVSGGKDSTYQVHIAKKVFGMHPLCVTYKTPLRTELGQQNLDNLISRLRVDLIELTVSPETERKFILKALREVGDCGLPQHLGIFSFTLRMASRLGIPLVIWGENSNLEYGGTAAERNNSALTREWAIKNGCLKGRLARDWAGDDLTEEELTPFEFPTDDEFEKASLSSLFLGYFIKWDPVENARISSSLGFKSRAEGPVMGIYDFADLDCKLIAAHHYPKWHKFGMTRTFDNVSIEIRNGRMTRSEAIEHIRRNRDDLPPEEHLRDLCSFLHIDPAELTRMFERFRNPDIWKQDSSGRWYIPGYIAGVEPFVT